MYKIEFYKKALKRLPNLKAAGLKNTLKTKTNLV